MHLTDNNVLNVALLCCAVLCGRCIDTTAMSWIINLAA